MYAGFGGVGGNWRQLCCARGCCCHQGEINYSISHTHSFSHPPPSLSFLKDIFRRYPNRYESVISKLCDNLGSLDESEAKASMIWIVGQYAERIENADELLEKFFQDITDDPCEVHLALLTAVVKLFIKRPSAGQELVPKVLKWATEDVDNPDLRDRGFIYWRLLSTDPVAAKVRCVWKRGRWRYAVRDSF